MSTGCSWKPYDLTTDANRFFFEFEWQFNVDTWDAEVIFIDERTGKPPGDPVPTPGVGSKRIPWHNEVDFDEILGGWIMGG